LGKPLIKRRFVACSGKKGGLVGLLNFEKQKQQKFATRAIPPEPTCG
jgi:hypothetical protein